MGSLHNDTLTGEAARQYIGAWQHARGGLNAQALARDARSVMRGDRRSLSRLRVCRVWLVRPHAPSCGGYTAREHQRAGHTPRRRTLRVAQPRCKPRLVVPLRGGQEALWQA